MVYLKSIVYVGMVILVTWSQCAPADQQPKDPKDPKNPVIKFKITEKYQDKSDTVNLICGEDIAAGSHPNPKEACEDVKRILGADIPPPQADDCTCPTIYDPVDVTVSVLLPQNPKWYTSSTQFENTCMFYCQTAPAPHLLDIGVVPPRPTTDNSDDGAGGIGTQFSMLFEGIM